MSETREQLIAILDSILPIYHGRHVVFSNNGEFDLSDSVQQALGLIETILAFQKEVLPLEILPIDELEVNKLQACVEKMESGNREVFANNVKELKTLLSNHLPLRSRSITDEVATPINRKVMELLNDQVHVVLNKRDDLFDNNDPFDENAFQEANNGLKFSRNVYKEQLRTNTVEAGHADVFDCEQSNTSISEAIGENFVELVKAANTLLKSKIKPNLNA